LSQPPSIAAYIVDRTFFVAAAVGALTIIALVIFILWEIGGQALPAIHKSGGAFLVQTGWDAQKANFGILPQIWGALNSSLLALLISGFVGITIAIFLTQDFLPPRIAVVFRTFCSPISCGCSRS
jgi:phosphate transport system permease protein